jgi:anti-sigma-K factor RskA
MTTHVDDEQLADWALTGQEPDAAGAEHLQGCARCRESLAELREVAGLATDLPRLEHPPAEIWQRVTADLGLQVSAAEARDTSTTGTPAVRPASSPYSGSASGARPSAASGYRRRALVLAAGVAAILGLGVGIGATLVLTDEDNRPTVEATVRLDPLEGKTGDGSADLVRSTAGDELKVDAAGLDATQGFYEVWLINTDGRRMVSLGVLNPAAGGTFQVPPSLTTQGYRIVDVSLEPDDGNPEHSHDSIIRGTLPA